MKNNISNDILLKNFNQNIHAIIYDNNYKVIDVSDAFLKLFDLVKHDLLDYCKNDIFVQEDSQTLRLERKYSKEILYFQVSIQEIYDDNNDVIAYHEIYSNITELQNIKNEFYKDKVTNLQNYKALNTVLETHEYLFPVLILINIDNFKNINNLYGFEVGNDILNQFAQILQETKKSSQYKLYRLYADEFALFLDGDFMSIDDYYKDLENIKTAVKKHPFYIESIDDNVELEITIGVSLGQEEPLSTVDLALRYAKKNNLWFQAYNATLDITEQVKYSHQMKKEIQTAIEKNNLFPVYQPIVNIKQEIVKYEVLIRMKIQNENGEDVVVSPVKFLDESIRNKQYNHIMKIVLTQAFKEALHTDKMISINLSFDDIYNQTLVETICSLTDEYPQIASRLIVEILETSSIYNLEVMERFLLRIRKKGIKIAIDDFGMGHSNLSHLLLFKPDFLKIDAQFIKNIDTSKEAIALVKAIVSFCHELDIVVIAEHVHSKEVYDVLKTLDIDEYQGFYFYEPLDTVIN